MKQRRGTGHLEREHWWRGPTRLAGKHVEAHDADLWSAYDLYREEAIATALASVNDDATAVDFTTRYGFLHESGEGGRGRELTSEIAGEAAQIAGILELHQDLAAVVGGGDEGLLRRWTPRIRQILARDPDRFSPPPWVRSSGAPSLGELVAGASVALSRIVNDGLATGKVEMRIAAASTLGRGTFARDEFARVSHADDLLGFVYSQVAELIVGNVPTRRCEGCRRFFPVSDVRKRFHDDACRARHQMRALRARKATRSGKTRTR